MTEAALGTVLLVEGDEALQGLLSEALRGAGFEVQIADTAEEALAFVGDGPAPLVVTELGLEGESGLDLCRELLSRDADAAVVVLSGSDDGRLAMLAFRAGAADYVVKLWEDADDLVGTVKAAHERLVARRARGESTRALTERVAGLQAAFEGLDHAPAVEDEGDERAYRVLVVDDEPVTVTALGGLLSDAGYEVESALSAEEALPRLRNGSFQLLITDKNLPGQSGVELIRAARAAQPELLTVLMTGYGSLSSAVDSVEVGAGAYLLKPFEDLDALLAQLEGLCGRRQSALRRERSRDAYRERARAFLEAAAPLCAALTRP